MQFNPKKFVADLTDGAEAAGIDAATFGAVLIGALVNQLGSEALQLSLPLTRGQKAARTRARNRAQQNKDKGSDKTNNHEDKDQTQGKSTVA